MLDVSDRLPIAVVLVDDEGKLREFVDANADCLAGRLVCLERVEVHRV